MADIPYISLQSIRNEAGMQNRTSGGNLSGPRNGSNKVFTTDFSPIVDSDFDDRVDPDDLIVYVNGEAVDIDEVDARQGVITLADAPPTDAQMSADYYHSNLLDGQLEELRREATDWLELRVKNYFDLTSIHQPKDIPGVWVTVMRLWCGAMVLIRDYGSSTDTDLTSKDGYKKLGVAKSMLSDWIGDKENDSKDNTGSQDAIVDSDPDVFSRHYDENCDDERTDDEHFWRRK